MFNTADAFRKRNDLRSPMNPQPGSSSRTPPAVAPAPSPAASANPPPAPVDTPAPVESVKPQEGGSKLIVGPDIKLKGVEITDCDTLVVEGRVEATMDSRVIQIAENGVFQGNVGIDVADIRGRFEGELTARKQLIIRSTGRVTGTIRYGKITIEDGGELSGQISSSSGAKPVAAVMPSGVADVVGRSRQF
jgi:cytoskeletal protein CcmA (bactofilin family)